MYCIQCGVSLADSEKKCPLCGTMVFHPELIQPDAEKLYPVDHHPEPQVQPWGILMIVSLLFLLPMLICPLCDVQICGRITWSGYVVGALVIAYVMLVLPSWFRKPNPVVFVPVNFGMIGLYLLYISIETGGGWFLSFAFPVVGALGLITTAVVTLFRYIRRGRLFVLGGAVITLGIFMPVMELLMYLTFHWSRFVGWSLYPMIALILPGIAILAAATFRPIRDSLSKRFFL